MRGRGFDDVDGGAAGDELLLVFVGDMGVDDDVGEGAEGHHLVQAGGAALGGVGDEDAPGTEVDAAGLRAGGGLIGVEEGTGAQRRRGDDGDVGGQPLHLIHGGTTEEGHRLLLEGAAEPDDGELHLRGHERVDEAERVRDDGRRCPRHEVRGDGAHRRTVVEGDDIAGGNHLRSDGGELLLDLYVGGLAHGDVELQEGGADGACAATEALDALVLGQGVEVAVDRHGADIKGGDEVVDPHGATLGNHRLHGGTALVGAGLAARCVAGRRVVHDRGIIRGGSFHQLPLS